MGTDGKTEIRFLKMTLKALFTSKHLRYERSVRYVERGVMADMRRTLMVESEVIIKQRISNKVTP